MRVEQPVESDHQPIYLDLKGQIKRYKVEIGARRFKKMIWTEELKVKFNENSKGVEFCEIGVEEE